MLNTFGLAGAAGYQAGSFHLKLVNSCRLPVDQIICIYIIYIYMQNTFKGKHIHVSPKCLRSLNFCCGFRSKV